MRDGFLVINGTSENTLVSSDEELEVNELNWFHRTNSYVEPYFSIL